jgi:hypothetical protein
MGVSFGLSVLVSTPFIYSNYPANRELIMRGTFSPNVPPRIEWYTLTYCVAFFLALRYKRKPVEMVLAAMALGTCIAIHAVSFSAHCRFAPDNWEFIGNIFLFLLAVAFLPPAIKKWVRPWLSVACALTGVAFFQSFSYAAIHFPFQGLPKDYSDALGWLDCNTARDSEVLTLNPEVNLLIPAYTHDKVSLGVAAPTASDYSLQKSLARFFGALRFLGVDQERFMQECLSPTPAEINRRSEVATGLYRGEMEKHGALRTMLFYVTPDGYVREVMARAAQQPTALKPDYVWFGHIEKDYARKDFLSADGSWKEVFRNTGVIIYQRQGGRS